MRNLFSSYYQPKDDFFFKLWEDCIFTFDANILLHVYRYTPKTRDRFFEILTKLQDRIWIPHQAAYEYQKDRLEVISSQTKAYDKIIDLLDSHLKINTLKSELGKYNRHPFIELSEITENIEKSIEKIKDELKLKKIDHPDLIINDELRERLTEILDGRVGQPYPRDKLEAIYKEAAQRFKLKQPPGYEDDKEKDFPDKYGDVLIWYQLIDYAKTNQKSLIFVTDDKKEDWWLKWSGKTISPRPELLDEMQAEASVSFHMYLSDRFIEYASQYLKLSSEPEVIDEAREIRLQDENSQPENLGSQETKASNLRRAAFKLAKAYLNRGISQQSSNTSPPICPQCRSEKYGIAVEAGVVAGSPANIWRGHCSSCGYHGIVAYESLD